MSYPSHGFDLFRLGGCWVPVVDGEAKGLCKGINLRRPPQTCQVAEQIW